jgi:hypothetical protein
VVDEDEEEIFFGQLSTKECLRICDRITRDGNNNIKEEMKPLASEEPVHKPAAEASVPAAHRDEPTNAARSLPALNVVQQQVENILQFNPEAVSAAQCAEPAPAAKAWITCLIHACGPSLPPGQGTSEPPATTRRPARQGQHAVEVSMYPL